MANLKQTINLISASKEIMKCGPFGPDDVWCHPNYEGEFEELAEIYRKMEGISRRQWKEIRRNVLLSREDLAVARRIALGLISRRNALRQDITDWCNYPECFHILLQMNDYIRFIKGEMML